MRCKKGVDNAWLIKTKATVPLSPSLVKIKDGITALGMDSIFDMQTGCGWVIFSNSPDAISADKIRAHEEQLGQTCEYDKQNLYFSRFFGEFH